MAHQDYVSRSNKAPKKKAATKKEQHSEAVGLSLKNKLIILLTVGLLGGFSYFLWTIKDNEPALIDVPAPAKASIKKTTELPTPPKEKWGYVKDLKTKEIEVGTYETNKKGPYQMQCGSFRTLKQAQVLKANIAFSGIASQIKEVKGGSGTWFKVILGPYPKKRSAEKDKHKLRKNKINYCQIWLWR